MAKAAYDRGSRLVRRQADVDVHAAHARMDRESSEREVLKARVRRLERELGRARRALASSRATVAMERDHMREASKVLASGISHAERSDVVMMPGFAALHMRLAAEKLGEVSHAR